MISPGRRCAPETNVWYTIVPMNELLTPGEIFERVSEGGCLVDPSRGVCPDGCEVWEATVLTYQTMLEYVEKVKGRRLTAG